MLVAQQASCYSGTNIESFDGIWKLSVSDPSTANRTLSAIHLQGIDFRMPARLPAKRIRNSQLGVGTLNKAALDFFDFGIPAFLRLGVVRFNHKGERYQESLSRRHKIPYTRESNQGTICRRLYGMFWKSKEMGKHIAHIASAIEEREEFSRRAQESATLFGPKAIGKSRAYFWDPPEKPKELVGRFEDLGEWMEYCQAAIFEIWFHLGDAALKDLRSVAFGEYDWTQVYATRALCRLALNGIETAKTAEQIAEELPEWCYDQVMGVRCCVAQLATRFEPLQDAYERLIDEYSGVDPVDGFELIAATARFNPSRAKTRHEDFLRRLVEGDGLEGRTAFDDGHVVATEDGKGIRAKSGPTYPQIDDFHQIRAAMLLHEILPEDEAITARLQRWAVEHPNENVRRQLRDLVGEPTK